MLGGRHRILNRGRHYWRFDCENAAKFKTSFARLIYVALSL
ncbi:hypothetical protein CA12_06440 [Alienimonas californiensis]|uniref:Uncharacterized protein n=1 Tax=Alienimonas californiensis TaxID=2527989 RepID=A0A517P5B5_9PLAN|nr:hypothetical protein CA12_06440 [Alienimonas californiensis]